MRSIRREESENSINRKFEVDYLPTLESDDEPEERPSKKKQFGFFKKKTMHEGDLRAKSELMSFNDLDNQEHIAQV